MLRRVFCLLFLLSLVVRGEPVVEEMRRGNFETAQKLLESLPPTARNQRLKAACLLRRGLALEALSLSETLAPGSDSEEQLAAEVLAVLVARECSQAGSFLEHLARGEALAARLQTPYARLARFLLGTLRFETELEQTPDMPTRRIRERHAQVWGELEELSAASDLSLCTYESGLVGHLARESWFLTIVLTQLEPADGELLSGLSETQQRSLERLAAAQPALFLGSLREFLEVGVTFDLVLGRLEAARAKVARLGSLATGSGDGLEIVRQVKLHLARVSLATAEGRIAEAEAELDSALRLCPRAQTYDPLFEVLCTEVDLLLQTRPPGWMARADERLARVAATPGYGERIAVRFPADLLLARLRLAQGRVAEAERVVSSALDFFARVAREAGGSRHSVSALLATLEQIFAQLAREQLGQGDALGAFETLHRLQKLQQAGQFDHKDLERQIAPGDRPLAERVEGEQRALAARQGEVARLEREGAPPARLREAHQLLADSRQSYYRAVDELGQRYPAFDRLDIKPINFAKLQRSLPADTLLVQLFPTDQELFLLQASRDSLKIHRVAITRAELDEAVSETRRLLQSQPPDWSSAEAASLRAWLRKLDEALVMPLESDLAGRSVLAIVPYGNLSYLPFGALMRGDAFLLERLQVVMLTKSSDLEQVFGPPSDRTGVLVALGNPDGTLPHAAEEVRSLGQLFPGSSIFLGAQATPSQLSQVQAPAVAYLHLATHGVLDSFQPRESYLVMGSGQKLSVADIAGYRLDTAEGDVSLVTLSACQTALAGRAPPDGSDLRSLADAFSFAGCRSMLASLWRVDDRSTRDMMVSLYRHLKAGDSKALALQKAQQELRQAYPHPFHWAPFVLIGDWR